MRGMNLAIVLALIAISVAVAEFPKTLEWDNVVIGGGGFIAGLVFNPSQKGLAYLRTDVGGIYRLSSDQSWTPITDIFTATTAQFLGAESVATDPKAPNRLYYAAGLYAESWSLPNGSIFSSTDQGNTWSTQWNAPFKMGGNDDGRSQGERLAVHPVNNSIVYYASQQHGLWRSDNYGASFSQVTSFPVPPNDSDGKGVVFVQFYYPYDSTGNTIVVGVDDFNATLYITKDGGDTWNLIPGTPTGFFPHHGDFTSDGKYLVVSLSNGPGPSGITNGTVYKYELATGVWTNITPLAPGVNGNPTFGYGGLALDAQNPNTIMVATIDRWYPVDDVFRSIDGGVTWKSISATAQMNITEYPFLYFGVVGPVRFGWWMGMLKIDPFDPNRAFFGTGATLYSTSNLLDFDSGKPTNWAPQVRGVEEVVVADLVVPPSGPYILHSAVYDLGGFSHTDLTVSPQTGMWTNPRFTIGRSIDYAEFHPNVVVRVGTQGEDTTGSPYGAISWDYGQTWADFPSQPAWSNGGGTIHISADATTLIWAPAIRLPYYSFDNGTTWTLCGNLPLGNKAFVVDRVSPNIVYAMDMKYSDLYLSTNYAKNFTKISTGHNGFALEVSPLKGDLWIPSWDGLWHSTDGGNTFTLIKGIQNSDSIGFGKAYNSSAPFTIYISGQINYIYGVYGSIDGGETWDLLNDASHQWGLLSPVVGDPNVFGRVFIGTNGRGIIMGS